MGNGIDYYFVAGNSMDDVISGWDPHREIADYAQMGNGLLAKP